MDKYTDIFQFYGVETPLDATVFDVDRAHRVKQVHSAIAVEVNSAQSQWSEADGIVTRTPNVPIAVITADCVPVLFCGYGVVGAAHAGWQGALNGVLDSTIEVMDVSPKTITAYIGPSIQQKSYEVSEGFERPFVERDREASRFFVEGQKGKLQFDLPAYCAFRLKQCGVENIVNDERDTLTNPHFHSHRDGAKSTERNLSAIMIRNCD